MKKRKYILAKYKEGKDDAVEYYIYDDARKKLARKRIRMNHIADPRERKKQALQLCEEINECLKKGITIVGNRRIRFDYAINRWLQIANKMFSEGQLRRDSIDDYRSRVRILLDYNEHNKSGVEFIDEVSTEYFEAYLDYIYMERQTSVLTRNNYLNWIKTICKWLYASGYTSTNVAEPIKYLGRRSHYVQTKAFLRPGDLETLKRYLTKTNQRHYLLACYLSYYCFIRPKELSMLRIHHINFEGCTIVITQEVSKNHRTQVVTTPRRVMALLRALNIDSYPPGYFVFSVGFAPGPKFQSSRKFRAHWDKIRERIGLSEDVKFYGLKGSGITDMLRKHDTVTVRDQARHSSIAITDIYTPHDTMRANPRLLSYENDF